MPPADAAEASSSSAFGGDLKVDELFNSFLGEVDRLPVRGPVGVARRIQVDSKPSQNTKALSSASEECERIANAQLSASVNSYDILLLKPDASEDEIKRQYKKISLLIHPDKCKHPKAHDVFQAVTKAYEELQRPDMRARYQKVLGEARHKVLNSRAKENKTRAAKKEPLLGMTDDDIAQDVANECDEMLRNQEEKRAYAEKCRAANERYEKEQEANAAMEEMKELQKKRKWIEERNERVSCWREFKTQVNEKKVKILGFVAPTHKKEERPVNSAAELKETGSAVKKKGKRPMGVDEAYKSSWR